MPHVADSNLMGDGKTTESFQLFPDLSLKLIQGKFQQDVLNRVTGWKRKKSELDALI